MKRQVAKITAGLTFTITQDTEKAEKANTLKYRWFDGHAWHTRTMGRYTNVSEALEVVTRHAKWNESLPR